MGSYFMYIRTMFLVTTCVFLLSVLTAHALTDTEIAAFSHKDGAKHISVTKSGDVLTIKATGWPDHAWKSYNPNDPKELNHQYTVTNKPVRVSKGTCLPMSVIGFAINGVPYFSPYTAEDTNAGVCEKFDSCDGHADPRGAYHYHKGAACVVDNKKGKFIGVALDGHPIYSAPSGFDTSSLDSCHGAMFDDNGVQRYRYILTDAFPYILGCFRGEIIDTNVKGMISKPECRFPKNMKDPETCGASAVGVQEITMLLGNILVFLIALIH